MAKKEFKYQDARNELHDLLAWFESGSSELDKALDNYKRAEELIAQIEAYLADIDAKLQVSVKDTNE